MINVVMVDDSSILAAGLKKLFESSEEIKFVKNFTTPEQCIGRINNDRMIDIVLMDVRFPKHDIDGVELTYRLRKLKPFEIKNGKPTAPRIIFFSTENKGFVDIEMGVHGLIPKETGFDTMVEMIKMVYKFGGVPNYPEKEKTLENPLYWQRLSPTEKRIFCMVINGMLSKEISEKLNNKKQTVYKHRKNILAKMKSAGLDVERIDDPRIVKMVIKYKLCHIEPLDE
ncbi:MAG: response regulator transcription factor [Chitinophagales bacterium]|nr:response regulator transcription factor [Chitinophagales bacterium]